MDRFVRVGGTVGWLYTGCLPAARELGRGCAALGATLVTAADGLGARGMSGGRGFGWGVVPFVIVVAVPLFFFFFFFLDESLEYV